MPSLSNTPQIKKLELDGYSADDPAWVEMDVQPLIGKEVAALDDASNAQEIAYTVITSRIKKWNLTWPNSETGAEEPAPINEQMCRELRQAAINQLSEVLKGTISGLSSTEKKS